MCPAENTGCRDQPFTILYRDMDVVSGRSVPADIFQMQATTRYPGAYYIFQIKSGNEGREFYMRVRESVSCACHHLQWSPSLTMSAIFSKGHYRVVCVVFVCLCVVCVHVCVKARTQCWLSSFYYSLPSSSITHCLAVSIFNNSMVWSSYNHVTWYEYRSWGKCGKKRRDRSPGLQVSLLPLSVRSCERCFSFMCLRSLLYEMRS